MSTPDILHSEIRSIECAKLRQTLPSSGRKQPLSWLQLIPMLEMTCKNHNQAPPEFTFASASPLRPLMMDGFSFSSRRERATRLSLDWNYFRPAAVCKSFFFTRHKNEGGVQWGWARGVLSGHRPRVFSGSCVTAGSRTARQQLMLPEGGGQSSWRA